MTFSGGLDIDTTSGVGLNATTSGTVEVLATAVTNTVNSGTGTAVNITDVTIGSQGVTFESVSANGAPKGIVLTTTGTQGGFTVTGVGTTDASGGTIQNITTRGVEANSTQDLSLSNMDFINASQTDAGGAGVCDGNTNLACNGAIYLASVIGAHFTNILVDGSDEMGINGNNVTDFDLVDSTVKNAGNASDEHGVHLRNLFGTVANGQVNTITNSTITASSNFNLFIQDSLGTNDAGGQHDRIEIANSIFSDTPIATTGGDGITFSGRLTANMKLVLTNSTLDNNATDGIQCDAGDTSAVECTVTGTTVRDNNIGLNMSASGTATLRFDISNNPLIINRLTGDGGAQLINTYAGVHQRLTVVSRTTTR